MRILVNLGMLLLLPAALLGQAKPKRAPGATSLSSSKLLSVKVTGSTYTPEAITAAGGLEIGKPVNEESFKLAAQKLGETGLFTDVAYNFSFSAAGTKLEFQLAENKQLIPTRFDNFVWYTDQALIAKVAESIPLFQGRVPVGGGLVDQVADVLDGLLAQRNPQFHVRYLRAAEGEKGPIEDVVFSVTGADLLIRNVEFPGARPERAQALAGVAKKIQGAEYLRSGVAQFAKFEVQPIYMKQGFLKATFAEAQPKIVSDTADETVVDVTLPVDEGQQYKFTKLQWNGNTVFLPDRLQPLIHAQANQPFNGIQFKEDLEAVRRFYGTRGYMKAALDPEPQFNEAEGTVAYTVEVKEGDQYKMGEVDFDGVDDKTVAKLREDWKLPAGEAYDSSYPLKFFKETSSDLPGNTGWNVSVHESLNDKDKTVDVQLRYTAKNAQ